MTRWGQRFFASTRGKVVTFLRQGDRTVDDLAKELDLTDNAIRAHLAALERDGIVEQSGQRRSGGKPAYSYGLTPEAEELFPKADAQVLQILLDVLSERMPSAELDLVLREVAQRATTGAPSANGDLHDRVENAITFLDDLGGLAISAPCPHGFMIDGRSCPLAAAAAGHPAVCQLAATMLAEVVGDPVVVRCDPPHCRFEVPDPDATNQESTVNAAGASDASPAPGI